MKEQDAPIFLIGYRGTGKSTVAEVLAKRLGWQAADADDQIEQRAGKSIAVIFAEDGEPAFRDLEAAVVSELAQLRLTIVSLGGGAVLRANNREALRGGRAVAWLTATIDTIEARLAADERTRERRPNLTNIGGRAEIERLLAAREPMYRQCATLVVATDGKSSAEVAEEILAQL
jgi:shikimate kinase